ncbi:MAG: hypothetical protein J1E62_04090 [Lachnospiraceae bacterium]|nr:hypothetical protein [Lachnospiraceae bacterium]
MQVTKIAKNEYVKWLLNSRMIVLGCILILMYVMVLQPLKERAAMMGEPLNLLEGYIGLCNSPVFLAFLPVLFLVLVSDFPKMDYNMVFLLHRCGRRNWITGQLLFLFLADITVLAIVFAGMVIPLLDVGFWYNGWSNVITEAAQRLPEGSSRFLTDLIPPNLYFQLTPFVVAVRSSFLMFAYFYLLGVIMMFGKFFGKRVIGLIVSALLVVLGAGASYFSVSVMWLLPAAHAIVSRHYTDFYREMHCSMQASYWYFLILILLLCCGAYLKGRKLSFSKITDIE